MVIARLEADVHRRARRRASRLLERHDLGVRPASALVPALADDGLVFRQNTPHPGIRSGGVEPLIRKRERPAHHRVVEGREAGH